MVDYCEISLNFLEIVALQELFAALVGIVERFEIVLQRVHSSR